MVDVDGTIAVTIEDATKVADALELDRTRVYIKQRNDTTGRTYRSVKAVLRRVDG